MFVFVKQFLKGTLATFAAKLVVNYRHLSLQLLEIEAAKTYVQGVRISRLVVMAIIGMLFVTGLTLFGLVLLHVGIFMLLPVDNATKACVAVALGLVYMAAGIWVLMKVLAEKVWLEKSGANEMIRSVTKSE